MLALWIHSLASVAVAACRGVLDVNLYLYQNLLILKFAMVEPSTLWVFTFPRWLLLSLTFANTTPLGLLPMIAPTRALTTVLLLHIVVAIFVVFFRATFAFVPCDSMLANDIALSNTLLAFYALMAVLALRSSLFFTFALHVHLTRSASADLPAVLTLWSAS